MNCLGIYSSFGTVIITLYNHACAGANNIFSKHAGSTRRVIDLAVLQWSSAKAREHKAGGCRCSQLHLLGNVVATFSMQSRKTTSSSAITLHVPHQKALNVRVSMNCRLRCNSGPHCLKKVADELDFKNYSCRPNP